MSSASLYTDPFDYITLAGSPSPGLADIIGAKRDFEWLMRHSPGNNGGVLLFQRAKEAEFEIRLRLYEDQDLADYDAWIGKFRDPENGRKGKPPPGRAGSTLAYDIQHPLLETIGISSVVVRSIAALEFSDTYGCWVAVIKLLEAPRPPREALKRVDGSKAAPPHQPTLEEMEMLTNQKYIERQHQELAR